MESTNILTPKTFALRYTGLELAYFRRILIFIKSENTFLKQQISEALQNVKDKLTCQELEHFKIKAFNYDTMIFVAFADIAVLTGALRKAADLNECPPDVITKETSKIRKALLLLSKNFLLLNSHLSKFLTDKS